MKLNSYLTIHVKKGGGKEGRRKKEGRREEGRVEEGRVEGGRKFLFSFPMLFCFVTGLT